eukprot:12195198-Alexandrium_andersonii.AAC.1
MRVLWRPTAARARCGAPPTEAHVHAATLYGSSEGVLHLGSPSEARDGNAASATSPPGGDEG